MPFDFSAVSAPFRMQPGLRRIAPEARQLTPNAPADRALREKLGVLQHHAPQALLAAPGFDAAPALGALMAQAAAEHPDAFVWDGALAFDAARLGWSIRGAALHGAGPPEIGACLRALPPAWRLPGLLSLALAEDFAVIDGATARIPWLAVCLPSRWAPEEKVGRHFAEVHTPVADNSLLITAADHLARLVTGADHWERFVWTLTAEPRLMQHPRHVPPAAWPPALDADALAAHASFRTEHQTFIPLPEARQAVFTIGVESRPLIEAIDSPARARQLHDALASMSDAVLAYRGLTDARGRLLAWLATAAA
ncbi:MAG: heme-dependent oxidative N-demethylase subunit alpha family protein [Pseudomonadota bacterium]